MVDIKDIQNLIENNGTATTQNTVNDIKRLLESTSAINIPLSRIEPPLFGGSTNENVEEWFSVFDRFCRVHGLTDNRKASLLPTFLQGLALSFYNQKETENARAPLTFDAWKQQFQNEFPVGRDAALKELQLVHRAQKPNESVSEFAVEIRKLVKAAYPTLNVENREIIGKGAFLRGLKPSIKRFTVIGSEPSNLDEAIRRAVQQEIQEQVCGSSLSTCSIQQTPNELKSIQEAISILTQEVKSLKIAANKPRFDHQPRVAFQGARNRNYENYTPDGKIRCFKCNKTGHHAAVCYKNRQNINSNQQPPQVRSELRSSLPHVSRGKNVLALETTCNSNEFPNEASDDGCYGFGTVHPGLDDDYFGAVTAPANVNLLQVFSQNGMDRKEAASNLRIESNKIDSIVSQSKWVSKIMNCKTLILLILISSFHQTYSKTHKFYQCDRSITGFAVAIPDKVHCVPPKLMSDDHKITVEVWPPKDEPYTTTAYHCRLITRTICTFTSFFWRESNNKR